MSDDGGKRLLKAYNDIDAALKRAGQASGGSPAGEVSRLQAALPKIVVVGSQSAGKSSVLNRLSGSEAKLLAIGGGRTVTRTPIRLQLVCEEKLDRAPYAYVYIQGGKRGDPISAVGDAVDRAVRKCTSELTGDTSFSKTEIVVEYHDINVVPLTLVDLPGLMAGGPVQSDVDAVQEIVKHFVVQENTIVVAVSKSTDDGANDPSFNLIRLYHPNNDWIAVHSKLDLLEADQEGPEKMQEKVGWLRDQKVGHNGKHFGVIAVERTPEQLKTHDEYWTKATSNSAWVEKLGEPVTFGIDKLSECMHGKLLRGFKAALPELITTLEESISAAQKVVDSAPAKIDGDIDDLRRIVSGIITEVVDTIGPEPKAGYALPDTINQSDTLTSIWSQLDSYVSIQERDFLSMTIEQTYKKLKSDPSSMFQDYDHGDVPLFHEIISRFDPDNVKNYKLRDLVNNAFEGYLNTIVTDLVLPKLTTVKWKSNERINVRERFPNLCDSLDAHIRTFFMGKKGGSILEYVHSTVDTILLLTARFAPATSVKEHRDRAVAKTKHDLDTRLELIDTLKNTPEYKTLVNRESERMLARLTGAVKSWTAGPQETERLLQWLDTLAAKVQQMSHSGSPGHAAVTSKKAKRLSANVGGGGLMKASTYIKLFADGPDAGKLRWYKSKDDFMTSPTQPLGEIDIRKDSPVVERYDAKMGPKYGVLVAHGKVTKRFQYGSRTEREDMLAELLKWRDCGGDDVVRFTGWFAKKGPKPWDGFRRRFFVLTQDQLRYYMSEGGGQGNHQKGIISIKPGTTAAIENGDVVIRTGGLDEYDKDGPGRMPRKLKPEGSIEKAEELCRLINAAAEDATLAAIKRLNDAGPDISDAAMNSSAQRPRAMSFLDGGEDDAEWADVDGTESLMAFAVDNGKINAPADLQASLNEIYNDAFAAQSGSVSQYTEYVEKSTQAADFKKQVVTAVADNRRQFTHACRYIGDQLKLELSKVLLLLRREFDRRKDDFIDDFVGQYKGDSALLKSAFTSNEDEAALRDRAEKRRACYEEAKNKCMDVQRGTL